jgi:hypothetical protein
VWPQETNSIVLPSGLSPPVVRPDPVRCDRRMVAIAIPAMTAIATMKMMKTGLSLLCNYSTPECF